VSISSSILAQGPWETEQLEVVWSEEPFAPHSRETEAADVALGALRDRGSPSHDGLAARLAGFAVRDGALRLELEPVRWALRLIADGAAGSLSALCIVRSADGAWLAGRRAQWLASWAGRWALGAGGAVEVGENPGDTLGRELRLPSEAVLLVGQAWLAPGAQVVPDDEHDEFAWWPADVTRWPDHADEPLRRIGLLLSGS
jgi:hypothetical protein